MPTPEKMRSREEIEREFLEGPINEFAIPRGILEVLLDIRELLLAKHLPREEGSCPPHNLIDYHFHGAWSGTQPPPNKMCTKCLMQLYV